MVKVDYSFGWGMLVAFWGLALQSINPYEPRHMIKPEETVTAFLIGVIILLIMFSIWFFKKTYIKHRLKKEAGK